MIKQVSPAYFNEIRFEIMKNLEECHELLRQLPDDVSKEIAYHHIEEAHASVQNSVE